jgi:arabinofuranan 3-O-arabinosyltransferase
VWVRARQGPNLADLIRESGTTRAVGDADPIDVLGSAYAATDGDPRTAWTAPQNIVQHRTGANLELRLPTPTDVTALRLTPSATPLPAHPTLVAVDLGDGPQVRRVDPRGGTQNVALHPRRTDVVKLSILDWDDVIDRTALGFDQVKPPGLAEVAVLDGRGAPVAVADAARNRERAITLPCGRGPIIGMAGQFLQTSVDTTVADLLDGRPIEARPCLSAPIPIPQGQQELVVSPGPAFVVDGVQLATPLAAALTTAPATPARVAQWANDRRELDVAAAATERVLVVPESVNPGWVAHGPDGAELTAVTVNGWQQGWVLPAGTAGAVTLTFASNALYRVGLFGGLALLPVLALLALLPVRRRREPDPAARTWHPTPIVVAAAVLGVGFLIAGITGIVVSAACLGARYALRGWASLDRATVFIAAGGLTLAGAVLSQEPWRSVEGYIGHWWGVQLLALFSVATLAASTVPLAGPGESISEQ